MRLHEPGAALLALTLNLGVASAFADTQVKTGDGVVRGTSTDGGRVRIF